MKRRNISDAESVARKGSAAGRVVCVMTLLCLAVTVFAQQSGNEKETATPKKEPEATKKDPKAASGTANLKQAQEKVADKYIKLEQLLIRMAELEGTNNPQRASLLKRAAQQSSDRLTRQQLQTLTKLLAPPAQLKRAIDEQQQVVEDLKALLELLQSENRSDRLKSEQARIRDYIKEVDRLIRLQKGVQGRTEGGDDANKLAGDQRQVADRTGQLSKRIQENEEGKSSAGSPGSESDKDDSSDSPSKDDSKDGEKSDSKAKDSKGKDSKDKDADGKSGDGKSSDGKSSDQKSSEGKSGDGKSSDKKSDDKDGSEKKGSKSDGEKKGSDKKGSDKDGDKSQDENKDKDDSDGSKSGEPKEGSSSSKSKSQSKSSKSQSEPKEGGESSESDDSNESQTPQESDQQNPARKRLDAAEQRMRDAQKKLAEAKRKDAREEQEKAADELARAKAELEQILRQLREEEIERTLAMLEGRFRQMLEGQLKVYESTKRLDKIPADQRTRDVDIQASKLSFDESKLVVEADKALLLLREEGSSVAFPETVELVRDDMQTVADRLATTKIDRITQGIEEEIIQSLEELIAALQKAQQELKDKRQQQQQKMQQMDPSDRPLVDKLAELKMIRALQMRVNTRTQRYARLLDDMDDPIGRANTDDLRQSLIKLAEMEQRVFEITRNIVVGKNE